MNTLPLRSRRGRAALAALLAVAVGFTAAGCTGTDANATGSTSAGSEALSIAYLPKLLGNPYFDNASKGAKEATTALGGTFTEVGPAVAAADAQVSYINTLAQQQVGGVVLSASDPSALGQALTTAREAGTKVVTFDSDVEPQYRDMFVGPATDESISKAMVDQLVAQIGDSGDIAILGASANAANQNAWIGGMNTYIASNFPNLKVVDTFYGNDDDQMSFDKTAASLQKNPNLKGIIASTNVGLAAAARYISQSSFKGKVALTGLGTPNATKAFIQDGTVKSFVLFSPADMGYLASYAIDALRKGTITGTEGDKFSAGRLGDYTVGANGVVYVGAPIIFDASNIDQYDF
ncbi:MAG: sugar transporter substrate-binding protein [Subtercola sp.]|nr:sugar transporter substrate-binding protein [Subtercola sp.]